MALLTRTQSDESAPIGRDRLEAILSRVRLIDLASLRRYEQTDPEKVDKIRDSLLTLGVLINPVIADTERQLLIDGHHRAQAFQRLGLTRIPAFDVDYFSESLTVEGWSHATEARRENVERAIERISWPGGGPSKLIFDDHDGHTFASKDLPDSWESARHLAEVGEDLRNEGSPLIHCVEADALRDHLNHGYIRPVAGKKDVIEMVERGELFHCEVNRHVVEGRPLGLCAPIDAVDSESRFSEHLDRVRDTAQPIAVGPESRQGGRFYQERLTLLQAHASNS